MSNRKGLSGGQCVIGFCVDIKYCITYGTDISDAPRAQRGASRKLMFYFWIVPVHPCLQDGVFSVPAGKTC